MFVIAQVVMAGRQTFSTIDVMIKDLRSPSFELVSTFLVDIPKLPGLAMVSYCTNGAGRYVLFYVKISSASHRLKKRVFYFCINSFVFVYLNWVRCQILVST